MPKIAIHIFSISLLSPLAAHLWAQKTYTAASCNQSDVNAVINGATHTAVNGDVIQIPSGTCTWTSGITVPSGIGITIQGSGTPNSTPSTTGASASCTATAIIDHIAGGWGFILQPTVTSSLSRISCLEFLATGQGANTLMSPIAVQGTCNSSTCPNIRIDNITFDASFGLSVIINSQTVMVTDNVFGVIDHNTLAPIPMASPYGLEFINYNNSAWNGIGQYGDNSWASADSFGTAKALYVENNLLGTADIMGETESGVPKGGEGGGRIVARFNNCNGCIAGMSNHGTESNGRPRGGRQIEFYGNTMNCVNTGSGCQGGVPIRSGVAYMFGNSLTAGPGSWFNSYLLFAVMRTAQSFPVWGQCNGSNPYDNNSPSPVICIDQSNRSGGTLYSGNPPVPMSSANQVLDPSYEWNDSGYNPTMGNVNINTSSVMTANHDWYTDNSGGTPHAQTSPTSPFNGTGGVGFGTLANRPTTCTHAVGYWATDQGNWNRSGNGFGQGELFVCTATNTWTLYYTPYTYPHPLASGGTSGVTVTLNPPTSLQAAGN